MKTKTTKTKGGWEESIGDNLLYDGKWLKTFIRILFKQECQKVIEKAEKMCQKLDGKMMDRKAIDIINNFKEKLKQN